ncbi:MAG: hypothetical protein J6J24_00140 [Clostridia bacterium]|nr:hypothetical protein [Clostridia bacterium]
MLPIFLQDIEWGSDGGKIIPHKPSEKEKLKAEKKLKKAKLKKTKILRKSRKYAEKGHSDIFSFSTKYYREMYGDNKVDDAIVDAYKFAKLKKRHKIVKATSQILRYPAIAVGIGSLIAGLMVNASFSDTINHFKETAEYQEMLHEEIAAANKAYANGKISEFEYVDKIEVLDDESHIKQMIQNTTSPKYQEEVEKYNKNYDAVDAWLNSSIAVLGAGVGVGIASACMSNSEEKKKKEIHDKYKFSVL